MLVNKEVQATYVIYKAFDMKHNEVFYNTKMPDIEKQLKVLCSTYVVIDVKYSNVIIQEEVASPDPLIY
jgi:hypothetical protein